MARYDIPPGTLDQVLNRFAASAGFLLAIDGTLTAGKTSAGLAGNYGQRDGLAAILAGSGLEAVAQPAGGYALRRAAAAMVPVPAVPVAQAETSLPEVRVRASAEPLPGDIPKAYAGGQVARGGRLGVLGDVDVFDTPFSVTHYTRQTIESQQARTVGDVVANDPSVRNYFGQSYQDQYTFRGFRQFNFDTSFNGLYGMTPNSLTDTGGAERVEVFKGPTALLNGISPSGAVGGQINVVPKRAEDTPLTRFTASHASDSQFGGHLDLGRRFGEDKSFDVRLNATYRDGDLARDQSSQQLGSAVLALDYRGERWRLSFDGGYQQSNSRGVPQFTGLDGSFAIPAAPEATVNYAQPWERFKNDDRFGVGRVEFDLSDQVTAYAAYGSARSKRDWLFTSYTINDRQGDLTGDSYTRVSGLEKQSGEAGLRASFDTGNVRHKAVLAASLYKDNGGDAYLSTNLPSFASNIYRPVDIAQPDKALLDFSMPPDSYFHTFKGVVLADTLSAFAERVQLTLGIRHQNIVSGSIDAATGARSNAYDTSVTTPLVGIVVKPTKALSLYANYIEGLQQGYKVEAPYVNAGDVLPPFKSKQYEIGAKYDFGSFGATLALFQITQPSDIATPANSNPSVQTIAVNGEQRNRGIELNVFGEAARGVRLLGGVMLLDAKLQKTQDGLQDGQTAGASPKTNINIGVEWDTPLAPGLTLSSRGIYTSAQYLDGSDTQSIPSWFRLDLGASYKTQLTGRPLTLRAGIENLLNKGYWSSTASQSLFRGAPRTVLLSATVDF